MLLIVSKRAQQRLYFLRRLRSFGLNTQVMLNFYRDPIESVLIFSITVWFGSITQKVTLRLSRVVKNVSRIIGRDLPSLQILYQQRLLGRATLISQDSSHPAHDLFEPLPSSRRFRSIKTRTNLVFPPSRSSPVKTEVIFLPPAANTYSTFR